MAQTEKVSELFALPAFRAMLSSNCYPDPVDLSLISQVHEHDQKLVAHFTNELFSQRLPGFPLSLEEIFSERFGDEEIDALISFYSNSAAQKLRGFQHYMRQVVATWHDMGPVVDQEAKEGV